jgi:hypothetical protein
MQQISVARVDFDAIEAGCFRASRRLSIVCDEDRDVGHWSTSRR